jgi:threonine dehydrogenase-like Zn-dependent dehydrogenase
VALDDVPEMYKTFVNKEDHCIKVVIDPWAEKAA